MWRAFNRVMTISALSHTQPHRLLPASGERSKTSSVASASPQDPAPKLSAASSFLNSLQSLQQNNPAQFQQVTQSIAAKLQQAATQASNQGDSARATALNKLASDFQTASQSGQMPAADQLQTDVSALKQAHHGGLHHGHFQYNAPPATTTDPLSELLAGAATN
jgi:hypothetical protein